MNFKKYSDMKAAIIKASFIDLLKFCIKPEDLPAYVSKAVEEKGFCILLHNRSPSKYLYSLIDPIRLGASLTYRNTVGDPALIYNLNVEFYGQTWLLLDENISKEDRIAVFSILDNLPK